MRLEWLEDILAIVETGSFVKAAQKRFVSQPAFSRRIRMIEENLGAELFDRSKKPVQLRASVTDQQANIREIATRLHELRSGLKRQGQESQNQIVIASQHAITTSVAPTLVKNLAARNDLKTQLRSANRDECYALLMTKQVDMILIHQSEIDKIPIENNFFQQYELDTEYLTPVCAIEELNAVEANYGDGQIPVVAYPVESFLGQVMAREVFPQLQPNTIINRIAETSLTLAMLSLARAGIGVAWIPDSLIEAYVSNGELCELSETLPRTELRVVAIGLQDSESAIEPSVWDTVSDYSD